MGYRSDIGLVVTKNLDRCLDVKDLLKTADLKLEKQGFVLYYYEYRKWYSDDPEIEILMDTLSEHINECYFIRIGEMVEDVEIFGEMYDNPFELGYQRKIVFDGIKEHLQNTL